MTTQQLQILSDLLIDSTAIVNENEVLLVDNEFNESVSSIKNALTTLFLDALNKKEVLCVIECPVSLRCDVCRYE